MVFYDLVLMLHEKLTHEKADKLRAQQQLEQLKARHVGTGDGDTTKFEFASNVLRDTYASMIGHPSLLRYTALAMGEPREKVRNMLIEKMAAPLVKPATEEKPTVQEDD
ncbi:SF3b10-domain-containing protein [Aulographum hederae CBS 113979]|uniref:SF3b10-domain-containing protein n=1 Tax=Aulographum hederae CBS 113979 TaxID=1176131 RepID=A0A6G1GWZ0_9PEZI|nr:SF3b10-domain-containing protein [Aulographum hederae CBS 113979]